MADTRSLLLISGILICPLSSYAQTDAQESKKKEQTDNQVFLNASSDSQPREISLGLPTNSFSALEIFEDGMPVSYFMYQCFPYKSWHGGMSASQTGTLNPMASSMRYGEINYFVNSRNKQGGDNLQGGVSYDLSQHGQHKIDLNLNGPVPVGSDWHYSASMYQNLDPGSNHLDVSKYQNRHQFYKLVASKGFNNGRGHLWGTYQFVNYYSMADTYSPFIFNGDGSVSEIEGFRLGIDQYLPANPEFTIMDVRNGEMKTLRFDDNSRDLSNIGTFCLDYNFVNGMHLDVRSRYKNATSLRTQRTLGGITESNGRYTDENGNKYTGKVQSRQLSHVDALETSWMNNAELSGLHGNHGQWLLGADYHWAHTNEYGSSANTAHEALANPRQLYLNGEAYYGFNQNSEYYDGYENKLALYGRYEWRPSRALEMSGFLRAEYLHAEIESANNVGNSKANSRYAGFNLTQATLTHFTQNDLNGAAGANLAYKFHHTGWGLVSEYVFTRQHNSPFKYGGTAPADQHPSDTHLMRAGFSFEKPWLNLVSQVVYISQSNKNSRQVFYHTLEHDAGGYPKGYVEAVTQPILFGLSSWGWTTDAMITPSKHFSLHLSCTLRNPVYKDFVFEPTFSDGVSERYDFSGRNVTVLHKSEVNIDPTFNYGPWRVWLSARYISKQYINKTNSLYFSGRWETFAGIDYKLNKHVKMHVNFINLLNQKGASGTIYSADLVEDASLYSNYLMSGTYIRPFTIEAGIRIDL